MRLESDRVRRHTAAEVLRRLDGDTAERVTRYADADDGAVAGRLAELEREWDTDRVIELEAALTGLAGLALGAFVRRGWFAIPAVVGASVFLHAMTGWYPLLPVFRRMGFRTAREINRERFALKAVRGDFSGMGERPLAPAAGTEAPARPVGVH